MMSSFYVRLNGKVMGPLETLKIRQLLERGKCNGETPVSTDRSRWVPLRDVEELRALPGGDVVLLRSQQKPPEAEKKAPLEPPPLIPLTCPACSHQFSLEKDKCETVVFCPACGKSFAPSAPAPGEEIVPPPIPSPAVRPGYALRNILLIGAAVAAAVLLAMGGGLWWYLARSGASMANSLPAVYQKKQRAIGLVTMTFQNKEGAIETIPAGTAFAIGKNKFVTNAHVAYYVKNGFEENLITPRLIKELNERAVKNGMSVEAYAQKIGNQGIAQIRTEILRNWKEMGVHVRDVEIRLSHSDGESFRVAKVQVHPRYDPNGEHTGEFDVAVFETAGETDCYFDIASQRELYELKPGTPIASAGFPTENLGEPVDVNKPEAFYASGDIRRISDFKNRDGGDKNNKSITHSIPATGGASGSPIFTANGKVVAVLWGGAITVNGLGHRTPSAALHNYAVRIDQIKTMTEAVPWDSWVNDPTK